MQNTIEFEIKDLKRVEAIVSRAGGSPTKMSRLAHNMAKTITKGDKAMRRCRAAESINQHAVAEIFRTRYQELVSGTATVVRVEVKPEMLVVVESVKFVRKEKSFAKPIIYFWDESKKDNLIDMMMQRYTPKQIFLPHIKSILEPLGLEDSKVSWSQFAGCSCPCSPGFKVDATSYRFDIHVNYQIVPKSDTKK